jgi:hypothetical protein
MQMDDGIHPPEAATASAADRERETAIAKAFVVACAAGDVRQFEITVSFLNETKEGWTFALRRLARVRAVSQSIKVAFAEAWTTRDLACRNIHDRQAAAAGIRMLMPGYGGPPLPLYRGTIEEPGRRRAPGFSWTTSLDAARGFAGRHRAVAADGSRPAELDGVVLRTIAPPEAVLLFCDSSNGSAGREVVVDPFRLGEITVVERLRDVSSPH